MTIENQIEIKENRKIGEKLRKGVTKTLYGLAITSFIGSFGSLFYGGCYQNVLRRSDFDSFHPEVRVYNQTKDKVEDINGILKYKENHSKKIELRLYQEKKTLENNLTQLKGMYPNILDDSKTPRDIETKIIMGLGGMSAGLALGVFFAFTGDAIDPNNKKGERK